MADEYSTPLASEVARIIRISDASSFAGSMGKFLLGVGVCIGAGLILNIVLLIIFGPVLGWTGWFWIYLLVLVPLIVWYERKSRNDYLMNAVTSATPDPSSTSEFGMNQLGIVTGTISSIFVWGPRGVVDGIRGMVGRRTVLQSAVIDRAVLLVLDLNAAPGGVEVKKLIHPPEDMHIFGQAVDMLDALDLIGKSTDGTSLWLISTFRQKLVNFSRTN